MALKERLYPETATWKIGGMGRGGGKSRTYLFVLPQKLPILAEKTLLTISCGGELEKKTKGQKRERCMGVFLFVFYLFIYFLTFSEAFIHFYILFYRKWDVHFPNHCISGVSRFFSNFIILKSQECYNPERELWRHCRGHFPWEEIFQMNKLGLAEILQSISLFFSQVTFFTCHVAQMNR